MTAQAMTKSLQGRMETRQFTIRFVTPAFLGNAEQDGQWRAPPFKHLLREWWRVAWAEANGFSNDYRSLREQEGALFGTAADGSGNRSRVRLRLDKWSTGKLRRSEWNEIGKVSHPEVGRSVGADLYLGFGPLTYDRQSRRTALKTNAAIQAGEQATLRLAFPVADAALLDRALFLIDAFGTLGGRSRNGWGSVSLAGDLPDGKYPLRDWRECLDRDWPHAIGKDGKGVPLIWRIGPFDDWWRLMRQLAEIKIGLRTQFAFRSGKKASRPESRHWLSHPVTHHNVEPWKQGRLPNSLRFKVVRDANGRLHGRIFHVPCLPPGQFEPDRQAIERVWQQVHDYLDGYLDGRLRREEGV
ncbi:MAG: hypothetical protein DSZ01_02810 [Gammaproteobacteria bacterium]|nr:MAG: hypothetical protein DSZ01_02810 [Gammaproteobacteria bacterium]